MSIDKSGIKLGVDVGGTFTDFLMVSSDGQVHIGKSLTTGEDPSQGVLAGTEDILKNSGHSAQDLQAFVHGTTVATNIILTRRGAKVGMLTTRGFRDTLDIQEKVKYDIYDLGIDYPEPLIPPHMRVEIDERVTKDGKVLAPLDEDQVIAAGNHLVEKGARALLVCFLHSYSQPGHEQQAVAVLKKAFPNLVVSCSSDISPDLGEFTRFATSSINMYIRPRVENYLREMEAELKRQGLKPACDMMLSTGATADFKKAGELPIRLIESGPAAGAIAAAYYGTLCGIDNLIAFDMGGTTAKACVIDHGKPAINYDHFEVARVHRFKKGSGIPLKAPSIDMIEIGAGGGSIARIDQIGLLKVGPDSAESNPGPACYGLGGTEPTVTDANLALGYLDGGFFLGGKMQLGTELAQGAISRLAGSLSVDTIRAAWGIHEVVSESMAAAARTHLLEKGRDARKYAMFAFGGSGPVHACRVARNLGIKTVICALGAGTLSALGLLLAPTAFDFVHTDVAHLSDCNLDEVQKFFHDSEVRGRELLSAAQVAPDAVHVTRFVELRYAGQGYEVGVMLPAGINDDTLRTAIVDLFEAEYERLYGRVEKSKIIETVKWRVVVSGPAGNIRISHSMLEGDAKPALKGLRPAYFPEIGGFIDTKVYDRYSMAPGFTLEGPAVVEEKESTAVVPPGWSGQVDDYSNLVLKYQGLSST